MANTERTLCRLTSLSQASGKPTYVAEELEPRTLLAAAGLITTPQTYGGVLTDKVVFTSGGHGWQYNTTLSRYATDRGDNNEIVEDFGNQEQMTAYADYALRAGATVVPMRPVGRQLNEVVLDNDSAGVTFSAAGWSNSSSTKFYDEDYGATTDAFPYRFASTVTGASTATVTYAPNIPQAGFYPVYTWVLYGTDRTKQTYTINHTGGSTDVTVDHSIVGSGWVYLGTYHFNQGTSATGEGSVVISNKAAVAGKVVIADAIRFGNGMGDYIWTGSGASTISGYPREDENSYHWLARSVGQGTTVGSVIGTSSTANVSAPSDYAEYMYHGVFGGAVYIGFHSNAGGGRGARGLIDVDVPEQTPHQAGTNGLADILGDQVNQDMQNLNGVFDADWTTGTTSTYTGEFGEINLGPSAEMDATIIEVAFHDSVDDAAIMRDPKGRDQIARSTLQGTVQYFSLYGSPTVVNTNLPSAPTNVRVVSNASGAVTLNWAAGTSSPASVYGNATTGYKAYASVDGYGFDGGRVVAGVGTTTLTITGLDSNLPYYFKLVATNAGGESTGTEVVAALPTGGTKQVLIVNGYDRMDGAQNFRYTYLGGKVDRVWPRYNNSRDYVIQMATAIQGAKPGTHVATTSNEAVISGAVNLSDYNTVIWISGTESSDDGTFNATEQAKVTAFINAGGNLFLSGSELGLDLDQQNNGRTFYESTLLANYVSDDAGTYTVAAAAAGIFAGMSNFVFSSGTSFSQLDSQVYDVVLPDVISPQAGAVSALTYSSGLGGTAGIQVQGTGGKGNIVMFAFPFEAMTSAASRQTAMGNILSFLGAKIDIETRVNGQDADSAPGATLAAGSSAALTYLVTNPGIVALSGISVVDDNGTPANAADDFNATFSSGDANSNGQLDVGETWTYTAARTALAGQTTRNGKASGTASSTTVTKTDPASYFGSAPALAIQTAINGQDADSAPGPTLTAGASATFTYTVTNNGNIALSNVAVVDNNGTPGNAADDFTPSFISGDTNSNGQLDLGETWTYSASRTVVVGQYSGLGSVSAKDSINQSASASDATNYSGISANSAAPDAPTLLPATDSGTSGDNITSFNNGNGASALKFRVTGTIAGATVTIYADSVAIGSAPAIGSITDVTTDGDSLHTLLDGNRQITARQTESGKVESADSSPALQLTIDTTGPTLANSTFTYLTSQNLAFQFNENMLSTISGLSLTLYNNTTSSDLDSNNFAANVSGSTVTFTFPGYVNNTLPNGNYTATFTAAEAQDIAGNALAADAIANFYFQMGDANHNGSVTIEDFNVLATNFGKPAEFFNLGNYNYSSDKLVTIEDFNLLATNFGKSVSTSAPAARSSFAVASNDPSKTSSTSTSRIGAIGTTNTKVSTFSVNEVSEHDDLLVGVLT